MNRPEKATTFGSKLQEKFFVLDQFGESFAMGLDKNGKKAQMSYAGSIFSLLLLGVTVAYSFLKINNLIEKKEVDIMSTVNQLRFSEDYIFSAEQGFNIAIAFTAYDSETEPILDPRYADIQFLAVEWDHDGYWEKEIPYHACSD